MKILLVHYRYFLVGGPERYMFNIIDLLETHGHTVIPFSVKHNKNVPSSYEDKYFLEKIGDGNEIYGHEYKKNFRTISKVIARMLYSFEAKRKLKQLIRDENPDLVYILQFQNKISCSVIDAAYDLKKPIVQRISDFGHICIDNIFYDYNSQKICEKCLGGSKVNGIINKCSNSSYVNSIIKSCALKIHDILNIRKKIDSFVIPASFTVEKFKKFGVDEAKIFNIPTFFNSKDSSNKGITYEDFFLYVGRVDPDKGLLTLVKAFENTSYKLVIVGSSVEGYDDYLRNYLKGRRHNVTFTGKLDFQEMIPYLKSCLCTICPSEWYDNFPNAVLESYAYRKAVIASRIGSLIDLVEHNSSGLHFEAGNVSELRASIILALENREKIELMGENGFQKLVNDYSSELHYQRLIEVFNTTISKYKK